jgi:hypothetical protein
MRRAFPTLLRGTVVLALAAGTAGTVAQPGWAGTPTRSAASATTTTSTAAAAGQAPLGFTPVTPTRLLDTRISATIHTRGPASTATIKVAGLAGVPATGVGAVVLNVTAIAQTHSTFVTVYPAGAARPTASNLNVALRRTRANEVITRVGTNGSISLYNSSGTTDLLVDVSGWFALGSSYTGQTPVRILDTRAGTGVPRPAASTLTVQVTGRGGVPANGVSAVVLNLTGISTKYGTYVTAYPTGTTRPGTSNLNLVAGQTAAMLVVAKPNAVGQVTFYNSGGPTHLILDIGGWFTGTSDYTPLTPTRLLDSRITGGFTSGGDWPLQIAGRGGVPADARAAVLTVTVVNPVTGGHVTVHPAGTPDPGTSSVNVRGGETTANLVVAELSADGKIEILVRDQPRGILVDVVGWLVATPRLVADPGFYPPGQVGQPYAVQLTAHGGYPPYSWTLQSGTLPAGLTLSADGLVSGTPTAATASALAGLLVHDGSGQVQGQPAGIYVVPFVSSDVWGWGQDALNDLPVMPAAVPALAGAKALASGGALCSATYAVAPGGTVSAWGAGTHGSLGDNDSTPAPASTPVQVSGLTDVKRVAAQACGGYALKTDGTVWAWGQDNIGQLGDGGTSDSPVPVQVSGLTGVTSIAGGGSDGYAVRSDGTVWAWGDDANGKLGNNGAPDANLPVQVSGLTDVATISTGFDTAYAITTSGDLWAWGAGASGELGDGTTPATGAPVPVQVTGLSNVIGVAAGVHTGYAVTDDGTAWAWGLGTNGELGNGGALSSTTPVQVSGLNHVTSVTGIKSTGFAITADGSVWAWGSSLNHLLGDDVFGLHTRSTPAQVRVIRATAVVGHAGGAEAYVIGLP